MTLKSVTGRIRQLVRRQHMYHLEKAIMTNDKVYLPSLDWHSVGHRRDYSHPTLVLRYLYSGLLAEPKDPTKKEHVE